MWVVVIGANEAILRRAPKTLNIIDIREGVENIVVRERYIQMSINHLTALSIKKVLSGYFPLLKIKKFVSFTEKYLILAAELNELYHLQANSLSCVQALSNKSIMRNLLNPYNEVWAKLVPISELGELLNQVDFDVIIKPVDGTGSQLITKYAAGEKNIDAILEKYHELEQVLVEKYIHGEEYSVEAISEKGKHRILSITKKFIDENFIETAHITPENIDENVGLKIIDAVKQFLNTVQLYEGPSHTEIMLANNHVYIIEGHSRTGGDRIVSLVRLTTGIDLIEAYFYQLAEETYLPSPIKAKVAKVIFTNFEENSIYSGLPDLSHYMTYIDELECSLKIGDIAKKPEHSGMRHSMAVVFADTYDKCNQVAQYIQEAFLRTSVKRK